MKLKTIGAALISAAVLAATSATAFAGMIPGGGIQIPLPDDVAIPDNSTEAPDDAEQAPGEAPTEAPDAATPDDVAPAPGDAPKEPDVIVPAPAPDASEKDNPDTGAQGAMLVIGAAVLAGAAVVVSRKKK